MAQSNLQTFLSAVTRNTLQRTALFRLCLPIGAVGLGTPVEGRLRKLFPNAVPLMEQGFLCESTSTPNRTFETTPMSIYGYEEKYPTFTTYTDLECTFISPLFKNEQTGAMRNEAVEALHAWQSLIQTQTSVSPLAAEGGTVSENSMNLSFPDTYRLKDGTRLEMFDIYDPKRNSGQIGAGLTVDLPVIGRSRVGLTLGSQAEDTVSPPSMVYQFYNVYPLTVQSSPVSWSSSNEYHKVSVTFAYSYWSSTGSTI